MSVYKNKILGGKKHTLLLSQSPPFCGTAVEKCAVPRAQQVACLLTPVGTSSAKQIEKRSTPRVGLCGQGIKSENADTLERK